MDRSSQIGFMQGRLSPVVDGKIQAFPWKDWKKEFRLAQKNGFSLMEWTLDADGFYENPLMTYEGREEIKELMKKHDVSIPTLTGDCFMQKPFYKVMGLERAHLIVDFRNLIESCFVLGVQSILVPLVDGGRLENDTQEANLIEGLRSLMPWLQETGMKISFESDLPPIELVAFINKFDEEYFGITYDIGNSASLGYNVQEEMECYADRVVNVHVKDRLLGGTTVPLGEGDADLPQAIVAIESSGYAGNYILQTARAETGAHIQTLVQYRDMVKGWIANSKEYLKSEN